MLGLASVFVVVLVSLVITRVATVALSLTGMSREAARFQARSAFFGVGFTTTEAESVMGHPVRRRIVMLLMVIGSAGIAGVIASVVVSFAGREAVRPRYGLGSSRPACCCYTPWRGAPGSTGGSPA